MLRDNLVGLIEPMLSSAGANPLALCTARKKPSDDRPPCLENPRPAGAESTLTENAASPFHAEPKQENQAFFVSSGVVLWKCSVERSRSKWHSRDLGILRGRRHQGEVHFAYKDTMDRLHCKLSL